MTQLHLTNKIKIVVSKKEVERVSFQRMRQQRHLQTTWGSSSLPFPSREDHGNQDHSLLFAKEFTLFPFNSLLHPLLTFSNYIICSADKSTSRVSFCVSSEKQRDKGVIVFYQRVWLTESFEASEIDEEGESLSDFPWKNRGIRDGWRIPAKKWRNHYSCSSNRQSRARKVQESRQMHQTCDGAQRKNRILLEKHLLLLTLLLWNHILVMMYFMSL